VVVAETLEQARDAAAAIEADITELPAIVNMAQAVADATNRVHDEIENNVCFDWGWIEDNRAAVDAAFKAAPHVTTLKLVNNRLVPNAMEPRASIGDYDSGTGDYKLYTTSQNPHLTRLLIAAFVMGIPENKLTVISPDVGGGFGSKIYHYGEEAAVLAASMIGPMQVAGRLAVLAVQRHISAPPIAAVSLLAMSLASVALLGAHAVPGLLVLFVLCQGAGNGVMSITRPVIVADLMGRRRYGVIAGLLAMPYLGLFALAPGLAGVVWTVAGYDGVLIMTCAAGVLGAMALMAAARCRVQQDRRAKKETGPD